MVGRMRNNAMAYRGVVGVRIDELIIEIYGMSQNGCRA